MVKFHKVTVQKGDTESHDFELAKIKKAIKEGAVYIDEGGTVLIQYDAEAVFYYVTEEDIEELGIDTEKIIEVEAIYWPEAGQ